MVTHHPASVLVDSDSSSCGDLHLKLTRRTISTPILQASGDNLRSHENRVRVDLGDPDRAKIERNEVPLKQSSSFIATNSEIPIVDISAFDYDAYRHKLIDDALKKQYDDYQPPGDVVLNSIHLNDNDSTLAVRLNDGYYHSFFDFIEEYYDATKAMSKKETEYLHPLDHFLVKGAQKVGTMDRETETRSVDSGKLSGHKEKTRISFYEESIERNGSVMKKQREIGRTG